jgi:hypothetical protein
MLLHAIPRAPPLLASKLVSVQRPKQSVSPGGAAGLYVALWVAAYKAT